VPASASTSACRRSSALTQSDFADALGAARHDMGAAREHGIVDAITDAEVCTLADTAYQGGGPAIRVPQRRR
jgi:hypothetical protein